MRTGRSAFRQPANPTGHEGEAALARICGYCREQGIGHRDEIYHGLDLRDARARRSPSMTRAIVVNSFSTIFLDDRWRVVWSWCLQHLVRGIERLAQNFTSRQPPSRKSGALAASTPARSLRPTRRLCRQSRIAAGRIATRGFAIGPSRWCVLFHADVSR